ncbi:hypothetical protein [Alcaligenes sp. SDU_A2]|uniref:hypothetical protein n=1 Tax=Alcaligenes sp. SDU_A2 TaxID=3136634 RepID=UPI00311FC724
MGSKALSADILQEFTKEEIIQWVRHRGLIFRVNRRDLLFIRWELASQKLMADYDAELSTWDAQKPDFKVRDALAVQLNATSDTQEKLRLLSEIQPYDKALQSHIDRMKKLDKRQEAVDRMYQEINGAKQ